MAESILTILRTTASKTSFNTKFVFDILTNAGVRYALIRGSDEIFGQHSDLEIDLLIHPEDEARFVATILTRGFVETLSQGHAPHRFFVAFSSRLGHWVKLNIVTGFYFGKPIRKYHVEIQNVWQQRRLQGIYHLAYEHELVTLLLHCLLDKTNFDKKHRQRLRLLINMAAEDDNFEEKMRLTVEEYLAPVFSWGDILQAVKFGGWQELLSKHEQLDRQLACGAGFKSKWIEFKTLLQRRLRPLYIAWKSHGISVVLMAPDGAGKSTLATSLIKDNFLKASIIYMGTNIEARTIGLPTTPPLVRLVNKINAQKKHKTVYGMAVRAINLLNSLFDHWYRCLAARYLIIRGRFVVFDRFIYDAWIKKTENSPWNRMRRFLFDATAPRPDLVVLLDAPGQILFNRKQKHSPAWIDKQRQDYFKLNDRLLQMKIVNASQTADQVRKEVTALIWKEYGKLHITI